MKKIKAGIRRLFAAPSFRLAVLHPNAVPLGFMCRMNQFLTTGAQVNLIVQTLRQKRPCRLLVFGLGNDSVFYQAINPGGRTVFVEDHEEWFREITAKYPQLEAYRVSYKTTLSEWRNYLASADAFATELPPQITEAAWDVIFVDAPMGFQPHHPGRMESIRLAAALIKHPGEVFVHDCEREVEDVFSAHYLKAENLSATVGNLRRYTVA